MKILLFSAFLFFNFTIYSQNYCQGSLKPYYFNSNHIRAGFLPRGNKFTDSQQPQFLVPFPSKDRLSTIFASSVWIGGFDDADNYKEAWETWPRPVKYDFSVGPLNSIGIPNDSICERFDFAWTVYYEDIQSHRTDFQGNSKIEDTIPSIFGWPARGNKFFKNYYDFELPNDNQGLAPFEDKNGNGLYDPDMGDYPIVRLSGLEYIPDQIMWMVFNDVDNQDTLKPYPLRFEIQLTAFAFHCENNELLNNTIFNSYKIINRAVLAADSVFFGIWNDYDLGCPNDDLIGCDSSRNTEFVYNEDVTDGDIPVTNECTTGATSYPGIPPVQSMTYLNYPMHSFIQFETTTEHLLAKYRLLNGMWSNGRPITPEGDGHLFPSTFGSTKFLFHGDPRDTASWAANNVFDYGYDQRTVSSAFIGRLDPGAQKVVETAYIYNYDSLGNQLDQITKMYNNVDALIATLPSLEQDCSTYPVCLGPNCIWPGDFDHNGIADHRDYLFWGAMNGQTGAKRIGLTSWRGQYGEDWNNIFGNINAKHGDADGNGVVNIKDIEFNSLNLSSTNKYYVEEFNYPPGSDIVLKANSTLDSYGKIVSFSVQAGHDLHNVLGIAFELEFDTTVYNLATSQFLRFWPQDSSRLIFNTGVGTAEYTKASFVQTDNTEIPIDSNSLFIYSLTSISLKPGQPIPDSTVIRIRNLIGVDSQGNDLNLGSEPLTIYRDGFTGTSHPTNALSRVLIYPNPTNQFIFLETELSSDILIFNLQGQELKKIPASQIHDPIDITSLIPGFYIVKILKTGQTCKFIKL